jgi:hypothetical protein
VVFCPFLHVGTTLEVVAPAFMATPPNTEAPMPTTISIRSGNNRHLVLTFGLL